MVLSVLEKHLQYLKREVDQIDLLYNSRANKHTYMLGQQCHRLTLQAPVDIYLKLFSSLLIRLHKTGEIYIDRDKGLCME